MERRPTLPVTEILAAERQERSWESAAVPGRCGHPSAADRGRGIGDLGMAGLNIGAPMRLQRGGRALPPAGASTPLGGDSGELPRTYSGSSARADYRQQLELNTQDSDEDVLFRQEMNYPERGAGGFSGLRRADAVESRESPPVQQLDVSEYVTASEAGSERGRRRHQGYRRIESLPGAGKRIRTHRPARDISLGADDPGRMPGGRTTYATAAQYERATAAQRTVGRAASQARREYAAAQARPRGKAGCPASHGTWVGGDSGHD
jgi:hypothetical protein